VISLNDLHISSNLSQYNGESLQIFADIFHYLKLSLNELKISSNTDFILKRLATEQLCTDLKVTRETFYRKDESVCPRYRLIGC
jgi:hypothetical protein